MSELSSFHEVRFPLAVSFGATGGPERVNEIVRMISGRERRNARFRQSRHRYDAGTGLRSLDDLYDVLAFFEARRGSLIGFRFRDPFDCQSCRPGEMPGPLDQTVGVGDGETVRFQLIKSYGEGTDAYVREIAKPVAGTVRVAVNAVEQPAAELAIDSASGAIAFAAPPPRGAAVTAGFQFDVPVRFDTDRIEASVAGFKSGKIPTIPLLEVVP